MAQEQSLIRFLALALPALLAELMPFMALRMPDGLLLAISAHLLIMGCFGALVYYICGSRQSRFPLLFFLFTLGLGIFGAVTCLASLIMYAYGLRRAVPPEKWIADFFSYEDTKQSDALCERISLGMDNFSEGSSVEPFHDILSGGTAAQKQLAIAKITRHFRPQFAGLLRKALQDPHAAVRVQAATAIAKIERDFMTRLMRLEKSLKAAPHSRDIELHLAHLYDEYAHAGLLDEDNRKSLRLKAIHIYQSCLSEEDNAQWRMRLARLHLRQDQPEHTRQLLEDDVQAGTITHNALLWYMEALFRLRKLRELRRISARYAHLLKHHGGLPFLTAEKQPSASDSIILNPSTALAYAG